MFEIHSLANPFFGTSIGYQQTEELFAHELIQRHANVVSIQELPEFNDNGFFQQPPKLGFYNYNFFHKTSGKPKIQLNSVWDIEKTLKGFHEVQNFGILRLILNL